MDGSSNNNSAQRDALLFHSGRAYRFLRPGHRFGGCSHPLKFGTPALARDFLARFMSTPAMHHRLHRVAAYWAAYFGLGGIGHDLLAWLAEQVFTGRLGLYIVVCGAIPRGEPKKPEEKKSAVRETASTVADNLPIVGPIKSALQAIAGVDLVTDEPVDRWGEGIGVVASLAPGGKLIAKVAGKKISEKLGEKGLKQAQEAKHAPDERFNKRYHGPDAMTRDQDGKLTEWEAKGAQDGNTRVVTNMQGRKQGSAKNNKAYADKILGKHKKLGKPSSRIGGPYTPQEMELWQEVKDNDGQKNHMSTHTNTETGEVRVVKRDHRGNIVEGTETKFPLNDFEATKKNLIKEYGE